MILEIYAIWFFSIGPEHKVSLDYTIISCSFLAFTCTEYVIKKQTFIFFSTCTNSINVKQVEFNQAIACFNKN
jgi:hypothetical protein